MNKILIVFITTLISCSATAQNLSTIKRVDAVVPYGSKKMSKTDVSSFVKANFKYSEIDIDKAVVYQNNHLLISYWDIFANPDFRQKLEKVQKGIVYSIKEDGHTLDYSKIITVNGIRYFVIQYEKNNESVIRFYSEIQPDGVNANGIIQFKKPYEEEAQKALQELLPTIKFKIN
ncbi:hypothetical protein [Mucilaginibacter glaciei]|uniref:Uncharacterized protein n=1 Tax=Mucilaginibacter glaciei TaxID=2772109 RepID=A0A926S3C7_9SPHI|nr:hypothetical protein [Mucilaginibacter glaciei]MBD1394089.1 hypothetical protein [Mucilaginibacter glaciei]